MADFVAKVPIAIGEGFHKASMQPLVAARSSRSGGCDALIPTPATQLQRYLTLRNTRNDRGRGPRHQFGETAQISNPLEHCGVRRFSMISDGGECVADGGLIGYGNSFPTHIAGQACRLVACSEA